MIVDTANYGLCLFSPCAMKDFLQQKGKSRTKRLLDLFQNNADLYLDSLKLGVWLPITPISSIGYRIKLSDEIIAKSNDVYSGFNIEVKENSLWLCDIGKLRKIDYSLFNEKESLYYYTLDNQKRVNGVKLPVKNGKYLVTISELLENDIPTIILKFDLVKTFSGFNDPRDDNKYHLF
ncbi:hypothetical protein [Psychrobacter sp. I-STPA10]|uniref:hypothetical protein n=1 Tax=Psychrobacter sp. I-STPA10 TaxID=2585769 RepID=UPI001E38573D|nr:hypothetical protein [Psychrobacter sp. I-STPA10]